MPAPPNGGSSNAREFGASNHPRAFDEELIQRPRPGEIYPVVHAAGFSDPSGHALTAASVYLTLALIGNSTLPTSRARRIAMELAVSIILLVGLSRIYLGVHYPSDVAAGLSFGAAWALLVGAGFVFGRSNSVARRSS